MPLGTPTAHLEDTGPPAGLLTVGGLHLADPQNVWPCFLTTSWMISLSLAIAGHSRPSGLEPASGQVLDLLSTRGQLHPQESPSLLFPPLPATLKQQERGCWGLGWLRDTPPRKPLSGRRAARANPVALGECWLPPPKKESGQEPGVLVGHPQHPRGGGPTRRSRAQATGRSGAQLLPCEQRMI